MQFECLILGTSDNQRVPDRHASNTTWSVHSHGRTTREGRESGEKIIEVGDYGVLGNIIIFCFGNQEHDLFRWSQPISFDRKNCCATNNNVCSFLSKKEKKVCSFLLKKKKQCMLRVRELCISISIRPVKTNILRLFSRLLRVYSFYHI